MNTQPLVSFSEKLHSIIEKNPDLFGSNIDHYKKNNAIDNPKSLEWAFAELQDENRLLNIGIVGRVKAGKSSLLNALVFQGESILPKAATPMTAALTTLTWGEEFQVNVEFFSRTDLEGIGKKAADYAVKLNKKTSDSLEELQNRKTRFENTTPTQKNTIQAQGNTSLPKANPQDMARRRALSLMQEQHPDLCAAFDQHQRMIKTGIHIESLEKEGRITAANPKELAIKLQDYVGAEGRFMPFAKAVHIFMPLEDLRDIRVIDTPGMNDPVQSREVRTVELLKTCDVVFIVSPAGQFLNEQDLEVMGRITTKEGVQKIVLVASQVDTQLYGSEKKARLDDAIASIRHHLAVRATQALGDLKSRSPEIGSVFDDLIKEPERNLLHSAGICHSLSTRHNQRPSWDANEQQTWKNLCAEYPDYFSDDNPDLSLATLSKLANMTALHDVLHEVRTQKDALQAEKMTKLWGQKRANLEGFQREILVLAEDRIKLIQNTNSKELDAQRKQLEDQRARLSVNLDGLYNECLVIYQSGLNEKLNRAQEDIFEKSANEVGSAEGSYTKTSRRKKDGFCAWFAGLWDGGYESFTETHMKIATGPVYSALQAFLLDIEYKLGEVVRQSRIDFDKNLSAALLPALNNILGRDFDLDMLVSTIRDTVAVLPEPEFSLGITIPNDLKSQGTLKSYEAERYKDKSVDFLYELKTKSKQKNIDYMKIMRSNFPNEISSTFVNGLEKQISTLNKQIENAAQNIDRLNRIIIEIQGISL